MSREIKFSHVADALEELSYPVDRSTAAAKFEDTTLLLADGEINLGEVIANAPSERFVTRDELESDLHSNLPREAVGEPYQSEGDA